MDSVTVMDESETEDGFTEALSEETLKQLQRQESRKVSDFQASKLEAEAARNWDLFYKRNSTNFFKDRHWTKREFEELVGDVENGKKRVLLEQTSLKWYSTIAVLSGTLAPAGTFLKNNDKICPAD